MNNFKKVFGSGNKKVTQEKANEQLSNAESTLLKMQTNLEKKIQDERDLAKKFGLAKNKRAAIEHLKRMKMHEESLKRNDGVLLNIQNQQYALNSVNMNKMVLDTMITAKDAMKTAHKDLTVEKVQNLFDDINDQQDIAKEVSDVISGNYGTEQYDEDELLEELAALEAEDQLLDVGSVDLPSVPTGEPISHKAKSAKPSREKDEEAITSLMDWAS